MCATMLPCVAGVVIIKEPMTSDQASAVITANMRGLKARAPNSAPPALPALRAPECADCRYVEYPAVLWLARQVRKEKQRGNIEQYKDKDHESKVGRACVRVPAWVCASQPCEPARVRVFARVCLWVCACVCVCVCVCV